MKPITEKRRSVSRSWFLLQQQNGVGPPLRRLFLLAGFFCSIFVAAPAQNPVIYLGASPEDPSPCSCLNNGTAPGNGQFSQTVTVSSDPGESWTVTAVTGFLNAGSPPPPAAPVAAVVGTALTETAQGIYQLNGKHADGAGFTITVTNGTEALSINNTCYYPNPQITGLPSELCKTSLPITLTGHAGSAQGTGMFRIDGQPATVFNPQVLTPGPHTVTYTFDAGNAVAGDPNDPGCSLGVSQSVFLHGEPNLVTNFQVNVPLNSQCEATIVPDMILEGEYPCLNADYLVTVFNQQGQPIGNTVNEDHIGQLLMVQVSSLAGG